MEADPFDSDPPRPPSRSGRVPPHNLEAEEALLGALLLSADARTTCANLIVPGDCYRPSHNAILHAVQTMHNQGVPVDPITVAENLRENGLIDHVGGAAELVSLQAGAPGTANAAHYAKIVVEHSMRRRAISSATAMIDRLYSDFEQGATFDAIEGAVAALAEATAAAVSDAPQHLHQLDWFLDTRARTRAPWVIPGLMRVGWRVMVVAPEGIGKSVLGRQLAMHAAQGRHPFTGESIRPIRTLLVDGENSDDVVLEQCKPIRDRLREDATYSGLPYDPDGVWILHRPDGLNIRKRVDRGQLEGAIAAIRPELICLGPLYKMFRKDHGQSDEDVALDVIAVLDDLRIRYGFALYIEHHAPKKQGGFRELDPFGSSVWQRWPEMGLKLMPDTDRDPNGHVLEVGRFRRDRSLAAWPDRLYRGTTGARPWEPHYPDTWVNQYGHTTRRVHEIDTLIDDPGVTETTPPSPAVGAMSLGEGEF